MQYCFFCGKEELFSGETVAEGLLTCGTTHSRAHLKQYKYVEAAV